MAAAQKAIADRRLISESCVVDPVPVFGTTDAIEGELGFEGVAVASTLMPAVTSVAPLVGTWYVVWLKIE